MRRLQAFVALATLVGIAAASAAAGGSPPPAPGRPDPLLTNLSLDYAKPLPAAGGGTATLSPLEPAAVDAAVRDSDFLRYRSQDDWGGFETPPLGGLALTAGGLVLSGSRQRSALELFAALAGGNVDSYVRVLGGPPPLPQPKPKPRPTPSTSPRTPQPPLPSPSPVPCANSGFGGTACGTSHVQPSKAKQHHVRKHRHKRKRKHLRVRGRCGKRGISIASDLPHCRITVLNGAPGYGTLEHLRIKNTTKRRFRLSFKAKGTQTPLWGFLELGVWRTGKVSPTPLPPLGFWTHRFTRLVTVKPGRTVRYTIELYLPASAGNAAQHQSASITFVWRAVAR